MKMCIRLFADEIIIFDNITALRLRQFCDCVINFFQSLNFDITHISHQFDLNVGVFLLGMMQREMTGAGTGASPVSYRHNFCYIFLLSFYKYFYIIYIMVIPKL